MSETGDVNGSGDDIDIEVIEVVTGEVDSDGNLIVDDAVMLVDDEGNILAADETVTFATPEGDLVIDETVSVVGEDGELHVVDEDVTVVEAADEG